LLPWQYVALTYGDPVPLKPIISVMVTMETTSNMPMSILVTVLSPLNYMFLALPLVIKLQAMGEGDTFLQ